MDEIKKLYDLLVREGKYTKSFEEFQTQWSDDEYKKKVYNVVNRDGFYTKDEGSFMQKYGMVSQPAEQVTETIVEEPVKKKEPMFMQPQPEAKKEGTVWYSEPTSLVSQEADQVPTEEQLKQAEKQFRLPTEEEYAAEQQKAIQAGTVAPTQIAGKETVMPTIETEDLGKKSFLNHLVTEIGAAGLNDFNKAITSIPEGVYNIFSIPQNAIAAVTGWDISTNSDKFKKYTGIENPALNYYREEGKKIEEQVSKFDRESYENSSIYENIKSGNYGDAFELLASGVVRSVPISLSMMVGGAYLTPAELVAASTVGFYDDNRQRLLDENPNMSDIELNVKALGMAGAEGVFESLGTGTVGSLYRDIIKKEGIEQGRKVFKNGLVDIYKKALTKYGVPAGMVGEGLEEAATQITQNMIMGHDPFEGVVDAFAVGMGSGVMFSAPMSLKNAKKRLDNIVLTSDSRRKINDVLIDREEELHTVFNVPKENEITPIQIQIANTPKARDIIERDLRTRVKMGEISVDDAKQSLYMFDDIQRSANAVKDLSVDDANKAKIANLLKERNSIQQKIKDKDDVLIESEKNRINSINDEIRNIINTYAIQKQAAGQVPVQPTTGVGEKVEEGKPTAEPKVTPTEGVEETVTAEVKEEVKPTALANVDATTTALESVPVEEKMDLEFTQEDGTVSPVNGNERMLSDMYHKAMALPEDQRTEPQKQVVSLVEQSLAPEIEAEGFERMLAEPEVTAEITPSVGISISNDTEIENLRNTARSKAQEAKTNEEKQSAETKVKVLDIAQKAIKTLKSVLPDFDIVIHDNEDSFNTAMQDVNGVAGSRGNFAYVKSADGKMTGRIDINLSKANARTVAHEVAHGILTKSFGENTKLFGDFRNRLSRVLKSDVNKELNDFANRYVDPKTGQLLDVNHEEFLAELTGMLEREQASISVTTMQKIAALINEFVSTITGGKFTPFKDTKDTKDIVDFFNTISGAIRGGEAISIKERERVITPSITSKAQLTTEGTGILLSGNETVIKGTNSPTVNLSTDKETKYSDDYTFEDIQSSDLQPSSRAVTLASKVGSGEISYKKQGETKSFVLPYLNKELSDKINRLREKYKSTKDKVQKEKIKKEINNLTKQIFTEFKNMMTQNLLALYDSLTPEFIEKSKQWYVGANRMANAIAKKYNLTVEQVSGIIGVLSPQKDWFNNVSAAERVVEIMSKYADRKITKDLIDKAVAYNSDKRTGEPNNWANVLLNVFSKYGEISINESQSMGLSEDIQSTILRAFDQSLHSPRIPITDPNGKFIGYDTTPIRWNSNSEIATAISIFRDGSQKNIDIQLGNGNKVRNFYNNIVDPNAETPYVTADTHALSAALNSPISAEDAVGIGLFNGANEPMYALVKAAYIDAARIAGIKPREMQSITWEAQRIGINDKNRTENQKSETFNYIKESRTNKKTPYERASELIAKNRSANPSWGRTEGITTQRTSDEIRKSARLQAKQRASQVSSLRGQPGGGIGKPTTGVGKAVAGGKGVGEKVKSKSQQPEPTAAPKYVRDISVLITPATVRGFDTRTERIKDMSIKYDKLVKEYATDKSEEKRIQIKELEDQILNDAKQEIIDEVNKIPGLAVKFEQPRMGLWEGAFEPSFNMTISVTPQADTNKISDLLVNFGEKYSQDAFILETQSEQHNDFVNGKIRMPLNEKDSNGLDNYPQIIYTFAEPISDEKISELSTSLQSNGIDAFSVNNNELKISVLTFLSKEQEQTLSKDEQYSEKLRDFQSKSRAAAASVGDVLGSNANATLDIRIKKSRYEGAINEKSAETTRQYNRGDILKPFQQGTTEIEALSKEFAALRNKQIEGKKLTTQEQARFDELKKIVQPVVQKTFEANKKIYEQAKREVENIAEESIKDFDATISPFPIKRPERASVKTLNWYSGLTENLGDGARVNIVVTDEADADAVFDKINEDNPADDPSLRRINETTDLGYPKRLIEVITPSGVRAEMQVITDKAYLAKDGVKGFTGSKEQVSDAKKELAKIIKRLGWSIPDGLGHYFYEVQRDTNVDQELRDEAKRLSELYYDAFTNEDSKLEESPFMEDVNKFRENVDKADKTNWDEGNTAKAPETLVQYKSKAQATEDNIIDYTDIFGKKIKINVENISLEPEGEINFEDEGKWNKFKIKHEKIEIGTIQVRRKGDDVKIAFSKIWDHVHEYKKSSSIEKIKKLIKNILSKIFPKFFKFKGNVIDSSSNKGKGLGSKTYGLLAKILQDQYGKKLISDTTRSDYAEALWRSLERKGLAKVVGDRENAKARWSYYYEYIVPKEKTISKSSLAGKDINNVIKRGRAAGVSERAIRTVLKKQGFTDAEIDAAMGAEMGSAKKVTVSEEMLPGFDRMMEQVDGIVAKSRERGANEEKVMENVMRYVEGSKAYQNASDVQKNQIIRDIEKRFGIKQKAAPKVERVLGIKDTNKVTMSEKEALKKQIKDLARGANNAKEAIRMASDFLSRSVKQLADSGKITVNQAANVIRKFSQVNVLSSESVERFVNYMTKVFADADYANKLSVALDARKSIAKLSKNKDKDTNLRALGEKFKEIDPSMVENIDEYNEIASLIKESIKGSTFRGAKLMPAQMVNIQNAMEYVSKTMEAQKKKMAEIRAAEIQEMMGVDVSDLSYEQMLQMLESKEPVTKYNEGIIRDTVNKMFDIYSSIIDKMIRDGIDPMTGDSVDMSPADKNLLKRFMAMDTNKLTVKEAISAVDALNNFIVNKSTAKMETVVRQYTGDTNANKLADSGVRSKPLQMYWIKGVGRFFGEQFRTLPSLIENMFKGVMTASKIRDASGITDIINGKAEAETKTNRIVEEYIDKFYKQKANGEDFNTEANVVERGMIAFMSRSVTGTDEQIQQDFNRRKKLIEESIDALSKGSEKEQAKAELYKAAYEKILKDSNSVDEVRRNADKTNIDAVDFWVRNWDSVFNQLADVSENVYNKILDRDINYSPDRFTRLEKAQEKIELSSDQSAFHGNTNTLYKKETGVLMRAERPESLPKDDRGKKPQMYIDLSFDKNNANSMYDAMVDINTAGPIRQVEAFINSEGFDRMIPEVKDAKLLKDRIQLYIRNIRNKNAFDNDEFAAMMKRLNTLSSIGVGQALGGVLQPIKQTIPVAMNTLVNAGGIDIGSIFNQSKMAFIDNSGYSIANRGVESQTQLNSINKLMDLAAKSKGEKALKFIEEANKLWLKIFLVKPDVFVARASWMSYYEQSLKKQGIDPKGIDYSAHKLNKEAANYAQTMVDRQQNTSDADLQGKMFTNKASINQLFVKTLLPFANFRMNQYMRLANDVTVLTSKTASSEDKKIAARSLSGYGVESAMFSMISAGSAYLLYMLTQSLMGSDEDDEEEEKRVNSIIKGQITGRVTDLLSPIPVLDVPITAGVNMGLDKVQDAMDIADEDKLSIYGDTKTEFLKSTGTLGISAERALQLYDLSKLAFTGEYTDSYGNEKKLSDESMDFLKGMTGLALLTNIGLAPSEANTIVKNAIRIAKSTGKTEKTIEREQETEIKVNKDRSILNQLLQEETDKETIKAIEKKISDLDLSAEERKEKNKLKKEEEESLLGEYVSKEQMKRYDPEMYEKKFGEGSKYYDKYNQENEVNKKMNELKRKIEDEEREYTKPRRKKRKTTFGGGTFGGSFGRGGF